MAPFILLFCCFLFILSYYYLQSKKSKGLITSSYNGIPIRIVSTAHSLENAIDKLLSFNPLFLGIDCEWRPNRKRGAVQNKVALIQIAHEKMIILIRLNKMANVQQAFISSGLLSIFSNVNILKCGVGINGDQKKLFRDYNMNLLGIVELNHLCSKYNDDHSFVGLKKLCKMVLDTDMMYKSDDKSVTLSDWQTSNDLSHNQIIYAAEDAIVSYKIFDKLIKKQMNDSNALNIDILQNICFGIIDSFKAKKTKSKKVRSQSKSKKSPSSKEATYKKTKDGPFYDNCRILKPNGEFLSWCRKKTLARYINKGNAVRVDENTIRLNFEPRTFNKKPSLELVLGFKKNECAVCGETERQLMRYFVVPLLYRKHLPEPFNQEAWRRHDMLPLCFRCHQRGQNLNEIFKKELSAKYNVAHYRAFDQSIVNDMKLMCAVKPLMNERIAENLPTFRKRELLVKVCEHWETEYEVVDFDDDEKKESVYFDHLINVQGGNKVFVDKMRDFFAKYRQMAMTVGKKASVDHATSIIKKFDDNLVKFIKMWRQHFVDKMEPKHLPDWFKVDNTFFHVMSNHGLNYKA